MAGAPRYVVNARDVIHETIDGEAVMIHLRSGNYYSLQGTGADVWHVLEQGATADAVVAHLAGGFGETAEAIAGEIATFLEELAREELIVPGDEGPGPGAAAPPDATTYEPPRLAIFTDMQDLILIDPIHEVEPEGWPVH